MEPEWLTRKRRIDPRLDAAGWPVRRGRGNAAFRTGVEKAVAERKRNLLVAMATGTGKTYTLVNQIYRLMRAGPSRT